MDERTEKRISEYLSKNGKSIDSLSEEELELFEKVDAAMNDRFNITRNAAETIKKNQFNVSKIAKIAGVPTSTINQDDLLAGYINRYAIMSDMTVVDRATMDYLEGKGKKESSQDDN